MTPPVPKKILLIDDEPSIRKLLADFFAPKGFTVLEAANGTEGLAAVRREKPALIFLDIFMPGQNGLEVLKKIKKEFPDIPVVMLTALYEEETANEAIQSGAYDYVTKPVDLNRLQEDFIDRILG